MVGRGQTQQDSDFFNNNKTKDRFQTIFFNFLMPEGHPLFLFSVDGRTWLCAVRGFSTNKWSYLLMDWDETRVDWS